MEILYQYMNNAPTSSPVSNNICQAAMNQLLANGICGSATTNNAKSSHGGTINVLKNLGWTFAINPNSG